MSDGLRPQGLQHARLPCPSLSPRVCSDSCPFNRWCHPTISSSVTSFSSCPQSFPASGSFENGIQWESHEQYEKLTHEYVINSNQWDLGHLCMWVNSLESYLAWRNRTFSRLQADRTLRGLNVLLTPEYNEGTRWKTNTKQLGTAENDGKHLSPWWYH